ncbi:MAG: DJ-1/PfpI/YhbO family deglycase/protease [Proteobacteria bacterium]|nr:DJ-1/PfpI/YhbO family deglycase/protease [Pseudomonadota bacterium]
MTAITDARILIVATDGFEQSELQVPLERLAGLGAVVKIAAPEQTRELGRVRGWVGGEQAGWGDSFMVDLKLGEVDVDNYDALVIPGGVMNPDKLRTNPTAVRLVSDFVDAGKVVAAICHGPWLLVEAGVVREREVTSYHSIKTDVENAGGIWRDEPVVADEGIITSRNPGDLSAFVAKIVEEVAEGRHGRSNVITRTLANALGAR